MTIQEFNEYFRLLAVSLRDIAHPSGADETTNNHRYLFVRGDLSLEDKLRLLEIDKPCLLVFPFSSKLQDENSFNRRLKYMASFGVCKAVNKNSDDADILDAIDECRAIALKVLARISTDSYNALAFTHIDFSEIEIDDAHFSKEGVYGSMITFNWEEGLEDKLVVDDADYFD